MKKMKIFLLISFITLFSLLCFCGFTKYKNNVNEKQQINIDTIKKQLIQIQELADLKYQYTNIFEYKDSKTLAGQAIPFTKKYCLIQYEGYIKIGTNFQNMNIKNNNGTIIITLNKSKILDNVIDTIHTYDEKSPAFNTLKFSDVVAKVNEEKDKKEKEIIQQGILEKSDTNIKNLLETTLKLMGLQDVQIKFN